MNVQGDTGVELDETFLVAVVAGDGGCVGHADDVEQRDDRLDGSDVGISPDGADASSGTSEAVQGLVSRSGGSGTGQYNIAFVVDRSGSTSSVFGGAEDRRPERRRHGEHGAGCGDCRIWSLRRRRSTAWGWA
ncbi:MAG: hypothetical protein U1E60_07210 [Reyranellaceae bacterium]